MSSTLRRNPALGYGLYLTAATLFGFNGTVSKTILATGISAARLSQLRVTLAFLVLLVVVLLRQPSALRIRSWAEARLLAVYGIAGVMLTQFMYFFAIHRIPVGITLIIEFTAPFMVAVWFRLTRGEAFSRRVLMGMCLAFVGLVLIAQVWQGFTLDALGTLAAWGAAVSLAVFFIMGERANLELPHRDALSITMWGFAGAAAVWAVVLPWWSFPWSLISGTSEPWSAAQWQLPVPLLVSSMVVLGTVITFWLSITSMRHITAAQASSFGMAEPVVAIIIAWALIGEQLSTWQVVGIAVTAVGIMYAERSRMRPIEMVE